MTIVWLYFEWWHCLFKTYEYVVKIVGNWCVALIASLANQFIAGYYLFFGIYDWAFSLNVHEYTFSSVNFFFLNINMISNLEQPLHSFFHLKMRCLRFFSYGDWIYGAYWLELWDMIINNSLCMRTECRWMGFCILFFVRIIMCN